MKTKLTLVLSLLCASMIGSAVAQSFDDANRDFAQGRFHSSTTEYQNVIALQGYSAPVLFNLGNSFFQEGDLGRAILAYKRSQWLNPSDSDTAYNLQLAQKQAEATEADPSWIIQWISLLSANGWSWLGCGALTLSCLSILARTFASRCRRIFTLLAQAGLLFLLISCAALFLWSGELSEGVIVDKNSSASISPFPAAPAAFALRPGEIVTVQRNFHDFLLITNEHGDKGWVNRAQVGMIVERGLAKEAGAQ